MCRHLHLAFRHAVPWDCALAWPQPWLATGDFAVMWRSLCASFSFTLSNTETLSLMSHAYLKMKLRYPLPIRKLDALTLITGKHMQQIWLQPYSGLQYMSSTPVCTLNDKTMNWLSEMYNALMTQKLQYEQTRTVYFLVWVALKVMCNEGWQSSLQWGPEAIHKVLWLP